MNRRLLVVGCVLVLMAPGSILLGFVMSLRAVSLQHVRVPPAARVHIDKAGTWLLWQVAPAVASTAARQSLDELPSLRGPSGGLVEVAPTIRTIRFTDGDDTFVVVGRYELDTPGQWLLGGPNGAGDAQEQWAIGLDPLPKVKVWSLVTVSLAIVLVGAGACTGWIALRRGPNRGLRPVNGPPRG